MALTALAKAAFAAVASMLARRIVRFGLVGMSAAGNAVDYRSTVVDMTVPGDTYEASPAMLAIMDEIDDDAHGYAPIDLSGTLPAKGVYPARDPSIITTHYWHHTATDTLTSFESLARGHVARGWPGIGYTGAIRTDGRFYVFHPLDRVTNHTSGRNSTGVATALVGNFDTYDVPPKMLATTERVRAYYRSKGIVKEALHRDVKATACPGRYATKHLRYGS